ARRHILALKRRIAIARWATCAATRLSSPRSTDWLVRRGACGRSSSAHLQVSVFRKADCPRLRDPFRSRGDIDAVAHEIAVSLFDDVLDEHPLLCFIQGGQLRVPSALVPCASKGAHDSPPLSVGHPLDKKRQFAAKSLK